MSLDVPKLETYHGHNRIVLVFASSPVSEAYLTQKQIFSGLEDGLHERNLLIFYLFSDEGADKLRRRFNVSEKAFTLVLIGKDGGEKERFLEPTQPTMLFDIIDQMPMRRREIREKK